MGIFYINLICMNAKPGRLERNVLLQKNFKD